VTKKCGLMKCKKFSKSLDLKIKKPSSFSQILKSPMKDLLKIFAIFSIKEKYLTFSLLMKKPKYLKTFLSQDPPMKNINILFNNVKRTFTSF
jgi:hypothetical protein